MIELNKIYWVSNNGGFNWVIRLIIDTGTDTDGNYIDDFGDLWLLAKELTEAEKKELV